MSLPKASSPPSTHDSSPCIETVPVSADEPRRVGSIPRHPKMGESFDIRSAVGHPAYTHYLFRFPAKFHPPVVSWALETYGESGKPVLDPFTGSGTVQVEALVRGMPSVGIDIDPLACFVTRAKTTPLPPDELVDGLARVDALLRPHRRGDGEPSQVVGGDISEEQFEDTVYGLSYPAIPNLFHWFRRHVVVDLARLFWALDETYLRAEVRHFFRACVASTIRRVSNADPYPVSALEVSRVQAGRNARRAIDVFGEFIAKAQRQIEGMASLYARWRMLPGPRRADAVWGDALQARAELAHAGLPVAYPLVVTSPPYCTAVNYSRRHKLEMYWLGLISDREQHIDLAHSYLGRRWVRVADWDSCGEFGVRALDDTLDQIGARKRARSRALRHYFWSMSRAFAEISEVMEPGAVLVCATGDSVSCGVPVATTRYLGELANDHFALRNHFSYVVRNRYMQYPLRNGVGIRREHILVLERRAS